MQNIEICCFIVRPGGFYLENRKSFKQVCELVDKLKDFLLQENNDLPAYLSKHKFLLKLTYLCDVFSKLNKLNVSMQGPDKNVLHVSDKIEGFIKKLSLWKNVVENVFGSSQYFTFLFASKKNTIVKFMQ